MKLLADRRLYSDTEYCLASLRALAAPAATPAGAEKEKCHFYWKGVFGPKQAFCLKSFLATQHLGSCEIWLWLDAEDGFEGHEHNRLLQPLLPFLRVLPFAPEIEGQGTAIDGWGELARLNPVKRSDRFRHLVLYKYGGTYFDFDVMFLRDFRGLRQVPGMEEEFAYQWSNQQYANSAILRLRQHSPTALRLLELGLSAGEFYPPQILSFAGEGARDLLILPAGFFDPIWLTNDGQERWAAAPFRRFGYFFRRFGLLHRQRRSIRSYRDFFPGAFAYHWHNFWRAPEHKRSYYGLFEREFDAILAALPRREAGLATAVGPNAAGNG